MVGTNPNESEGQEVSESDSSEKLASEEDSLNERIEDLMYDKKKPPKNKLLEEDEDDENLEVVSQQSQAEITQENQTNKWMNCLQSTKRMIDDYNDNPKHNKSNIIGKRIKMTDNDQSKPNYEDISDTESSPTIEMASEKKIEEIPPAQKTEDYPENVLKSAGLPTLS